MLLGASWSLAVADAPRVDPEAPVEAVRHHHEHHRAHRDDAHHHGHHHGHHDEDDPATTEAPEVAPAPPRERTDGCVEGMVRVTGTFCPEVRQECREMADDDRERCLRFRKPTRCRSRHTRALDFCIDRYEWPGREGVMPQVVVSWNEAAELCARAGRRLCHEDEWTLACEGPEMLPYPWGYDRDEAVCNIDRHNRDYAHDAVTSADLARAREEAARVSQAVPSGANARCVSPYGVHDMTGNVDEWAVSRTGDPYRSVLKGGYWGRVRTRCRPATRIHDEGFRYYQIGFRCCADIAPVGASPEAPVAPVAPVHTASR